MLGSPCTGSEASDVAGLEVRALQTSRSGMASHSLSARPDRSRCQRVWSTLPARTLELQVGRRSSHT